MDLVIILMCVSTKKALFMDTKRGTTLSGYPSSKFVVTRLLLRCWSRLSAGKLVEFRLCNGAAAAVEGCTELY